MRKLLLTLAFMAIVASSLFAQDTPAILINDKSYDVEYLIKQEKGPGILYQRIRIPGYPLNVNIVEVDLTNPYNRVETMQASETLYKTEKLETAAKRYTTDEKRVIAGANANFWCVSSQQPYSDLLIGATYNGNLRNGQIITETNAYSDQWDGGPSRTGVVAIDTSKKMWVESMNYVGYAINEKIGSPQIIQVNKVVRDEEIAMYNSFYGTSKTFMPVNQYKGDDSKQHFEIVEGVATEVYLDINEGQSWMAGRPMTCTVKEVKENAGTGTLGSYDLCLVGRGSNQQLLAKLTAGDQVTINYGWSTADGTVIPEIEQLIGGNAIVMQDGVKTGRNTDESYNSQVYSRTGYGKSADGNKLFIIVIDKSTDPVYGTSAGCSTSVMCDILAEFGCTDVCTMDAGGSAQMLVDGTVINKTTESAPRAVANGWFVYSIAPKDETVARLAFYENNLQAPPYSTYSPKVIAYNQYGDIVSDDFRDFTLSCDASIGTCEGTMFTAGGNFTTGKITASYNGVSVSTNMTIVESNIQIRIKPTILIDAAREYPIEVTASIGDNVYKYNPKAITWSIDNPEVATVDANGVLRGIKEGTAQLVGEIGEYCDTTTVKVEIANAPKMNPTDFASWAGSAVSGITNATLAEDGTLFYTYGSPRGASAYVQIAKDVNYYSIPDKLWIKFTSSAPLSSMIIDLRTPQNVRANKVEILPAEGTAWAANTSYSVELPISALGDPADLMLYPLSLHYIQFYVEKASMTKGEHTIKIEEFSAEYSSYSSGIEKISVTNNAEVNIYPNPVVNETLTIGSLAEIKEVEIYSLSGVAQLTETVNSEIATLDVSHLNSGVYFVRVKTSNDIIVKKIIVE